LRCPQSHLHFACSAEFSPGSRAVCPQDWESHCFHWSHFQPLAAPRSPPLTWPPVGKAGEVTPLPVGESEHCTDPPPPNLYADPIPATLSTWTLIPHPSYALLHSHTDPSPKVDNLCPSTSSLTDHHSLSHPKSDHLPNTPITGHRLHPSPSRGHWHGPQAHTLSRRHWLPTPTSQSWTPSPLNPPGGRSARPSTNCDQDPLLSRSSEKDYRPHALKLSQSPGFPITHPTSSPA
jgi:hypothetical protein